VLGGTTRLTVLATSREPLRVSGEHRWMLQPLSPADAATLFLDRAMAVDPTFDIDVTDPRVVELCRRLDGLPLALELAAPALSGRGLDATLEQLSDRFDVLTRNHRAAPERHRSLAAMLDWTYSRLDPAEQQAFDRLGVFAGTFSLDDAREVAGGQAARMLPQLVERSLVVLRHTTPSPHYEMLDTMRAYAHLQRGAALDGDRALHAQWMLAAASAASAELMGPDELKRFRWFRENITGFRQAHQWFIDHGDHDNRIRLVRALITWAWQHRQAEVMAWASALATDATSTDPDLEATRVALSAIAISRTPHADIRVAERCVEAATHASAPVAALAHYAAAEIGLFVGRHDLAEPHARRAFELASASVDQADHAALAFFAAIDTAFALAYLGRGEEADRWTADAEGWAHRLDCPGAHAWVGLVRAERYALEEPLRARVHAQRCLALSDADEHGFITDVAQRVLAFIGSVMGEQPSLDMLCRHLEYSGTHASWLDLTTSLCVAAEVLPTQQKFREAVVVVAAVAASSIDPTSVLQRSDHLLARLRSEMGTTDFDAAWAQGQTCALPDAVNLTVQTLRSATP
jgi:predicted ATPase